MKQNDKCCTDGAPVHVTGVQIRLINKDTESLPDGKIGVRWIWMHLEQGHIK